MRACLVRQHACSNLEYAMDKLAEQKSVIGKALCYIGWAIIGLNTIGFLFGLAEIAESFDYGNDFGALIVSARITVFLTFVAIGCFFFGISEIIRLLNEILETKTGAIVGKRFAKPKDLPKL